MNLTSRAQQLRKHPTDAERRLWSALRRRRFDGYKFRQQVPLGAYILDFMCREGRMIIEVDGAQHTAQKEYDAKRDAWLAAQGFRVMRFTDREVLTALDSVEAAIWQALSENAESSQNPHPHPPP